jgi:hypothetical protein
MKLIQYVDYELKLADEAYLVRPIRKLYNQDRSEKKEQFWRQMSYMFFMVNPASPYSYILNMEERAMTIIQQEGLPDDFKPSPLLLEAMDTYRKLTITPSQELLEAALAAARTVSSFLKDPNILKEVDDKGKPKHSVSEITRALRDVEGIVASLQNLLKRVEQELEDEGKARGGQELTIGDLEH